jgi:hypothetical protein
MLFDQWGDYYTYSELVAAVWHGDIIRQPPTHDLPSLLRDKVNHERFFYLLPGNCKRSDFDPNL